MQFFHQQTSSSPKNDPTKMQQLLTRDQINDNLKRNPLRLTGRGTRYNVFEDGRQSNPTTDNHPSILLHLRNVAEDAVTDKTELDLEVQRQVTNANFGLRDLGFDVFGNNLRKYWGNTHAVKVVNEWNAAIVKALGASEIPSENATWFVEDMIRHLGFDYTTVFGTQRRTFEEILKWVQLLTTSRFREWWAKMRPDHTQDYLYAGGNVADAIVDHSQYANDMQHQGGLFHDILLVQSGQFALFYDGQDVNDRTWAERKTYSEITFRGAYRMTPEQALSIWTAANDTSKENLADIFMWTLELLDHFAEWYSLLVYRILEVKAKHSPSVRAILTRINNAWRRYINCVLRMVHQRQTYGGITERIWARFITRQEAFGDIIRTVDSWDYEDARNPGTTKTMYASFHIWDLRYPNLRPRDNFPVIRPRPRLQPESIAPLGADPDDDGNDDVRGGGPRQPPPPPPPPPQPPAPAQGGAQGGDWGFAAGDGGDDGGWEVAGPRRNRNQGRGGGRGRGRNAGPWRAATICERCTFVSGETICARCGADSSIIAPVEETTTVKRRLDADPSIESPSKRRAAVSQSDAQLQQLRDILEQSRNTFQIEDAFESFGPEYDEASSTLRREVSVF